MKIAKKILAILLAMSVLLSTGFMAYAAETEGTTQEEGAGFLR